jgi:hypothetical protein
MYSSCHGVGELEQTLIPKLLNAWQGYTHASDGNVDCGIMVLLRECECLMLVVLRELHLHKCNSIVILKKSNQSVGTTSLFSPYLYSTAYLFDMLCCLGTGMSCK